jgi:hypothetical protein
MSVPKPASPDAKAKAKAKFQKASKDLKAVLARIQKLKAGVNAQETKVEALDKALE